MQTHGDHWAALYGDNSDIESVIRRDLEHSKLIDSFDCADIFNETERGETVFCLRWGSGSMVEDLLVVTDTVDQTRVFFSGYPTIRKGIVHTVTVDGIEPWHGGIEGWMHIKVTDKEVPLSFFDVRHYAGSAALPKNQKIDVSLAGIAYSLEPMSQASFELSEGVLWDIRRQQRLKEGADINEASRPVTIVMAALIPNGGSCDNFEFNGIVNSIDSFEHSGHTIYNLEIVVMRSGNVDFKLPIFASDVVLNGFVPRLGEDVQGVLWLQGYTAGGFGDGP
jgi:hypothetical protein